MGETEQAMSRRYGAMTREFPEETPLVVSAARNGNG
jgi:hypothetical protein